MLDNNKKTILEHTKNLDDCVKCHICGINLKAITNTHLKKHNMSVEDYKLKFPNEKIISNNTCIRTSLIRKGKTLEEIVGIDKAKEMKQKQSDRQKGKSYISRYGDERANSIKTLQALTSTQIRKNPDSIYNTIEYKNLLSEKIKKSWEVPVNRLSHMEGRKQWWKKYNEENGEYRTCLTCGVEFFTLKWKTKKFCSRKCAGQDPIFRKTSSDRMHKDNPIYKEGVLESISKSICDVIGSDIEHMTFWVSKLGGSCGNKTSPIQIYMFNIIQKYLVYKINLFIFMSSL
jgi:hypothetical protein